MFDKSEYVDKLKTAKLFFEDELKKIRTGRAHSSMLDNVKVEVYGTLMPLNQVANVTAPEAQMLLISPLAIRNIRQDALKEIKHLKDAKELSEDEARREEKDFDKLIADMQKEFEDLFKQKEKDILTI